MMFMSKMHCCDDIRVKKNNVYKFLVEFLKHPSHSSRSCEARRNMTGYQNLQKRIKIYKIYLTICVSLKINKLHLEDFRCKEKHDLARKISGQNSKMLTTM